jgi:hypothetical protein
MVQSPMTDFNTAQALQDELAGVLKEAKGMSFDDAVTFAEPIVRYLQQQYGGDELYIPRPGRTYPITEILAARDSGKLVKDICRQYGISRRSYYNLLSLGSIVL